MVELTYWQAVALMVFAATTGIIIYEIVMDGEERPWRRRNGK